MRYLKKSGGSLTGNLNLQNNRISGLASPTGAAGATNRGCIENYATGNFLQKSDGTLTGELSVGNNRITNLASSTHDADAVSKSWVEGKIPKGLYHLMAYVTGSPDSHSVEYKSEDVQSVTYRKVGMTSNWSFTLKAIYQKGSLLWTLTY